MDLKELHDYFERLAAEHKDVKHSSSRKRYGFYHIESAAQQFNTADEVFVAVESPLGSLVKEGTNYRDRKRVAVAVHVKAGNLNTNAERVAASNKAEGIVKDFIARIIHDSASRECPRLLRKADASNFVYEHLESKMPNFVTCLLAVEIVAENFVEYNPNTWTE